MKGMNIPCYHCRVKTLPKSVLSYTKLITGQFNIALATEVHFNLAHSVL